MGLESILPLVYYLFASLITIVGLKQRRAIRILLLGPIWLLSLLSLISSHRLSWLIGADSTLASLLVFYMLYSTELLAFDRLAVNPEAGSQDWSFVDCYRVWNNPRKLPLRLSTSKKAPERALTSHVRFSVFRSIKAVALWTFERFCFQSLFVRALGRVVIADFSPDMELLVFPLSFHQFQVRVIMSIQWIWRAYFFLEFYHSLLAIVFVGILRFDDPGEWPDLFGSVGEAYSVRGFWARFWHQLTIPTYVFYSRAVCHRLMGIRLGSFLEKVTVPLIVFTISGLSHSLVGWALGDVALSRDILFFELSFLATTVETAIWKTPLTSTFISRLPGTLKLVVGMTWVVVFFTCVSPLWIYPKVYHTLLNPAE
ncbi:hypothetical protein N7539_001577 [Penicillium diatomitis]|uniref:Wax synthase domain-containing protein n=1 Tax=Penicillium diatomitis TaxID=2819901 RepID=A0A9W9XH05_9EURO|nr:uncharacterized protein N7539_001577 [Penicillium diatomitis]KAJ5492831.1 hypothetical protein N7539_001577 [Penicillium diatomitis]